MEGLRAAGSKVEEAAPSDPDETKVTFIPDRRQARPVWDSPIGMGLEQRLLELADEDVAREQKRRAPRATYPPPNMFEVVPKIFIMRLDRLYPQPTNPSVIEERTRFAKRAVARALAAVGAAIYEMKDGGDPWFFGFPRAHWIEALNKATEVLTSSRNHLAGSFDPRISVSTYGIRDFEDVLSTPWEFIGTKRLNEALHCRVQFNPLEQHVRRVARDA